MLNRKEIEALIEQTDAGEGREWVHSILVGTALTVSAELKAFMEREKVEAVGGIPVGSLRVEVSPYLPAMRRKRPAEILAAAVGPAAPYGGRRR